MTTEREAVGFESDHPYVQRMIEAGECAVSADRHTEAVAYFSPDFVARLPGGMTTDYAGLSEYFSALRDAFPDLSITRKIAFGEGPFLAARTVFRGTFINVFTMSPIGSVDPHGRVVEWEITNIFRVSSEGWIAEEWVQMDAAALLEQLGVTQP